MYKLVKENLFEFQKGLDPVDSLGMGRRKLIKDWLDSMYIQKYEINDDYTIDVKSNVYIGSINLSELPEFIQFGRIEYSFYIDNNHLKSLRGCPFYVNCNFWCDKNDLTSLEGAPKFVGCNFWCEDNLKKFSYEDVNKVCDVKGDIHV